MKKILTLLTMIFFAASCGPESKSKHLIYKNITIISDLSSRIKNIRFPQKDIAEIHKIIQYFKDECVKPGEKIGDKSSISFSSFSEKDQVVIDLEKMKDLGDKQSFINSTGKYKTVGLENNLVGFENTVKSLYAKISNPGLDLISLLIEKVDNEDIIKGNKVITDGVDSTYIDFDNHIYIFTDGYLEYNSREKRQNDQYYFGSAEIERVRKYCSKNGVNITTALKEDNSLGLPRSEGKNNQYINLHVLETHERDKDTKYQTYKHSKGLRDNEILEAVWKKWANDSGFKSLEWKKY